MLVILLLAYSFYDRQFRLANIKGEWPKADTHPIGDKQKAFLSDVFSQPFNYLDRGKQSFVFVSQDQQYVLKFFDARCLRSGALPFFISIKKERCEKKMKRLFEGYQVALENSPDNSGLLFVQLAPDSSYHLFVKVVDRFNIKHQIDLSEIPFALQRKATSLRVLISSLLQEGKVEEAKHRFRQIIDMYVEEYQQGIWDLDHNFMYNTGFVDNKSLRIDLGRLQKNEKIKNSKVYKKDLEKIFIGRLGGWLERHFPKYRQEILEDMQKKIDSQ